MQEEALGLAAVVRLVGHRTQTKGHWFNSWSGHMPGTGVWSPVGVCVETTD